MNFYWYFTLILTQGPPFLSSNQECTISLSPQEPGPICSSSIVLNCSSCDLRYVRFEEFAADGFRFDVLTSNYILRNPDYEEVVGEGFYELRIAHVERYNCTRYRCFGYVDTSKIFSNEWKLLIPSKGICASAMNVTVMNTNSTTFVNNNQRDNDTMPTANEHGTDVELEPMLEWLGVIVVLIPLSGVVAAVCAIGAYKWHKGRKRKTGTFDVYSAAMQAVNDDLEDNSSVQVTMGVKVDSASTHIYPKLSDTGMQFSSNVPLQNNREYSIPSPRLCLSNTAVSRASHNPTTCREMESAAAVDSNNVAMHPNPAYVALERSHQGKPQAPWQLLPISEAEFSEESDVPIQDNPAYETTTSLFSEPKQLAMHVFAQTKKRVAENGPLSCAQTPCQYTTETDSVT